MDNTIAFSEKHGKIIFNRWNKDGAGIRIIQLAEGILNDDLSLKSVNGGIKPVNEDFFIITTSLDEDLHNFLFELRPFEDVKCTLCSWKVLNSKVSFKGDINFKNFEHHIFWTQHPGIHTTNGKLFYLKTNDLELKTFELDWYNEDNYDLGYQGVTEIIKIPEQNKAIMFVARSNIAIEINLTNGKCSSFQVGDNSNQLRGICYLKNRIIIQGYDTIYDLNPKDYKIQKEIKCQVPRMEDVGGIKMPISQFIGDILVDDGLNAIFVPRPFSSDILALNLDDLEIVRTFNSQFQPLQVFMIKDQLIALDYQSQEAEEIKV